MNIQKDERITTVTNKIGHEAFMLVMMACAALIVVNRIVLDRAPGVETWILIGSGFYYSLRCLMAGVIVMPAKRAEVQRMNRNGILGISIVSLAFGVMLSVRNCLLYQNGNYDLASLFVLLISSVSMFILILFVFIVYMGMSVRMSRKYED